MFIAVDFDNTVVKQNRAYEDTTTPLEFVDGAEQALRELKRGGHVLLLWSARASRALLIDPALDPFVRAGLRRVNVDQWRRSQAVNITRYKQMIDFVATHLPGVFDAVDDGAAGKPSVDRFIDDRAMRPGRGAGGMTWSEIAEMFGVPANKVPPAGALSVPTVAQEDDWSCGAAALLAVLRFFRATTSTRPRALYSELGTNAKDGTSPEAIVKAANAHGLRANWRTGISLNDLLDAAKEKVPVILDIQEPEGDVKPTLPDGHYVVLVGAEIFSDGQRFLHVMNPSGGKYETLPARDLLKRWVDVEGARGGVFCMGPG